MAARERGGHKAPFPLSPLARHFNTMRPSQPLPNLRPVGRRARKRPPNPPTTPSREEKTNHQPRQHGSSGEEGGKRGEGEWRGEIGGE